MKNNTVVSTRLIRALFLCLLLALPAISQAETYAYDAAGRLTGVTYDDGTTIAYAYDNNGNILSKATGPVPAVSLALNSATFNKGATMTLTAISTPSPLRVDVFLGLQLPDGTLFLMQPDGSFSMAITAVASNVPIPAFSGPIFNFTFTGPEPPGNYTWAVVFTQPGTLNIIGTLASAPFSFGP